MPSNAFPLRKKKSKARIERDPVNLFLNKKIEDLPRYTGRKLIILNEKISGAQMEKQAQRFSLTMANASDFKLSSGASSALANALQQADGVVFDKLKVAVVNANRDEQLNRLITSSLTKKSFIKSEPERYVYAFNGKQTGSKKTTFRDNKKATWGIHATNVLNSSRTGKGINIAILDTGFSLSHPDFKNRVKGHTSFIKNQAPEDENGHGSHCAGIEWALENKCHIVSMSLGGKVLPGERYSESYEMAASQALKNNCLIIAATGNESDRENNIIKPVGRPANCPSIMAVAALTNEMQIASFSCGGIFANGGQVDIAAPGTDIFSSWKNKKYSYESGTSMATPFVAGIAALLWEANTKASAAEIWMKVTQAAKRLNLNASDVGAGLAFV